MNVLDAASTILSKAGTPLDYNTLTEQVLEQNLWTSNSKTPEATLNAALAVDIVNNGKNSRFQRTAKGIFALRSWGLPEYIVPKNGSAPGIVPVPPAPLPAPSGNNNAGSNLSPANQAAATVTNTLTFSDAAEQVLDRYGSKQPMHYQDITQKALELDLITTIGRTPQATLYAQVLTEIDRSIKRGETPRFIKHGMGLISLSKWLPVGLVSQIDHHNKEVRKKLHDRLFAMQPKDFEDLAGQLLVKMGFENVDVTKFSGDGGIDVRGTLVIGDVIRIKMAVQVKRWKNNVQAPTVQQVRGSLGAHEQGLIITTSDFSPGAYKDAQRKDATPVALMNGAQLLTLLLEHKIGVDSTTYELFELS